MSNLSGFVKRLRDIMRNDAGINGDAQRIEQIAWMLFLKVYDAKEQDWEFDDEGYTSIIPEVCRWQNWAVDDKSGTALTGDQLLEFVNNTLFPVLKGKDAKKYGDSIYGIEKKQFPYMLCITNLLLHGLDIPRVFHDNTLLKDVLDYTVDDQFDVILMNPPYGGSEKADVKNHFPTDLASSETADLFMAVMMYRLKKGGRCAVVISDGFLTSIDDSAKVNIKKKLVSEFNLHTVIRLPGSVFAPYTDIPTNILFFDNTHPTQNTWYYRLDMPDDRKHFSKTKPMEIKHFAPVVEWWKNRVEIKDELSEDNIVETWKAQKVPIDSIIENGYALNFCDYPPNEQVVPKPDEVVSAYISKRLTLENKLSAATASLQDCLNGGSGSQLINIGDLAHQLGELNLRFPVDLRRSVLKAAVRGQLLEQKLEERCIEIKAIDENEDVPYSIPENWKWVRLSNLCTYLQRGKSPKYSTVEKIPVVSQKCNQWNGFQLEKARFIDPETLSAYSKERLLVNGDILINSTGLGTLGRAAIYSDSKNPYGIAVADSHVTVARLNGMYVLPEYFYAYWANPSVQFIIESQATGSTKQKELGLKLIQNYPIPLPPLAEQERIVAKLEEILPLCERLK